jgi:hypothetical protein
MLTAMQAATGRIATLGRQTVDLSAALARPPIAGERARVTDLVDLAVSQAALATPPAVRVPDAVGNATVRSVGPAVGTALAALIQSVSTDAAGAPVGISATDHAGEVELRLGPLDRLDASSTDDTRERESAHARLERGGVGLSLVLASYVFDAIGARLTSIGPDDSAVAVALPKDGGLQ